ncbi:hypothetical protein B5J92_04660 [Moraxella atlantae]|nr:hypothetical protein B5J92_04660 [Moraxella atlantae]
MVLGLKTILAVEGVEGVEVVITFAMTQNLTVTNFAHFDKRGLSAICCLLAKFAPNTGKKLPKKGYYLAN